MNDGQGRKISLVRSGGQIICATEEIPHSEGWEVDSQLGAA